MSKMKTFSTAINWTRTFGASAILDTRVGLSYYHNEAVSIGAGLNTSDEVGIRGANLDDFTRLPELTAGTSATIAAEGTLKIVSIDVEGGGGTLFVTPEGKSLLIDTGWPSGAGLLPARMQKSPRR